MNVVENKMVFDREYPRDHIIDSLGKAAEENKWKLGEIKDNYIEKTNFTTGDIERVYAYSSVDIRGKYGLISKMQINFVGEKTDEISIKKKSLTPEIKLWGYWGRLKSYM